jgi:hypothetical protein
VILAAAADWWARGVAIAAAAVAAASFGWNVYTWRQTNRVSLKASSYYDRSNPPGVTVRVSMKNRSPSMVTITSIERERRWRRSARRLSRWNRRGEAAQVDWSTAFPIEIPAGDTKTAAGRDNWLDTYFDRNVGWVLRVVLDDNRRFVARPSRRGPDGKLERFWPRRMHRFPNY